MPSDLFGDVTDPSIKLGTRKWYTVPLSLVAQSLIVLAVVVVPLMATGALPIPYHNVVFVPMVATPVPPPPPVQRSPVNHKPPVNAEAAPLESPPSIEKESEFEAGFESNVGESPGIEGLGDVHGVEALPEPPAPPPAPQKPVRVGDGIRAPTKIHDVSPVYPPFAQAAGIQGMVIIEATIGVDGRVRDARVLRSAPLLDHAALAAVREWIYTPTLLNGQPVSVVMTVTVRFQLR